MNGSSRALAFALVLATTPTAWAQEASPKAKDLAAGTSTTNRTEQTVPTVPTVPTERAEPVPPPFEPRPSLAPGIVFASLGVVGLGVGSTFGYLALEEKARAEDHCSDSQRLCDSIGAQANTVGRTYAAVGMAALLFGTAMITTSIWLLTSRSKSTRIGARVSPSMAHLRFETAF